MLVQMGEIDEMQVAFENGEKIVGKQNARSMYGVIAPPGALSKAARHKCVLLDSGFRVKMHAKMKMCRESIIDSLDFRSLHSNDIQLNDPPSD